MMHDPAEPQPPWECCCGMKFQNFANLSRHLRDHRRAAKRDKVSNVHRKVRTVTYAEANAKGTETMRRRRSFFLYGGGS